MAYGAYFEESFMKTVEEVRQRPNVAWKPGYNRYFSGWSKDQVKRVLGARTTPRAAPEKFPDAKAVAATPATFDARQKWPQCTSINFIRDQAACGSCWAISSAEVATDRTCIGSNGANQPYLSGEQLMTCCSFCGDGCQGGYPIEAMRFWQTVGLVTGGPYGSHTGCQAYQIPPCGPSGCGSEDPTPSCKSSCDTGYTTPFSSDKHNAKSHYNVRGGASGIATEIFTNGPVVAAFDVYEDFMHYQSGVYHHVSGQYLGGHAVKILGFGTESNTPFWLVANSWNTTWGDSGFFKIRRGNDECGFEAGVVAGLAK